MSKGWENTQTVTKDTLTENKNLSDAFLSMPLLSHVLFTLVVIGATAEGGFQNGAKSGV